MVLFLLQLPLFVVMTKTDVAGVFPPETSTSSSHTLHHNQRPSTTTTTTTSAMELALQGLDRVLWACMGKRSKIVGGVEEAEGAASAIKGGSGCVFVLQDVGGRAFEEVRTWLIACRVE